MQGVGTRVGKNHDGGESHVKRTAERETEVLWSL